MSEQEYKHIVHHLVEFSGYNLSAAIKWMHTPIPVLGATPVDLVKQGRSDEVWVIVKEIDNQAPHRSSN